MFGSIAAAIRAQNGLTVKYTPAEMAPAILALEWDVGLKPRAVLLADGTLEFNYLEKRRSATSAAKVVTAWEVAPAGYASSGARPWDEVKAKVTSAVIDASFAEVGATSGAYWFLGFSSLVEGADASGRKVAATGLVCANARYNAIQSNPWAGFNKQVARVAIAPDMATLPAVNMNYWFYGFGALTCVDGMCHLRGVSMMRFTFNSCTALVELDMRGMDPGSLTSLNYLFGACTALRAVLVDPDWELPSGVAGMATFYNCKSIVGGNGTTFNSSKTGYAMMRVDTAGAAGYLTAG